MLKRLFELFRQKRKPEETLPVEGQEKPVQKGNVMAKRYITYNERLNEKLNHLGFRRKNKKTFIKHHVGTFYIS